MAVGWVNYRLAELESSLPEKLFFRARREALVNVNQIKEIRPYFKSGLLLIMSDAAATEIVVSAHQAHRASAAPADSRFCDRCRVRHGDGTVLWVAGRKRYPGVIRTKEHFALGARGSRHSEVVQGAT